MKLITKIQSISDLITNSSSEVFINKQDIVKQFSNAGLNDGMIELRTIDLEWLKNCRDTGYRWEFICNHMGWNKEDFGHFVSKGRYEFLNYWDQTKKELEKWGNYLDNNFNKVLESLKGYVEIEISDHYDLWEEDTKIANKDSIYYESCH